MLISVTALTREFLRNMLEESELNGQEVAFRLRVRRDKNTGRKRFGLVFDRLREGDRVVEHEGRNILLVSERLATRLAGLTLQVVSTEHGHRLKFQRTASLSNGAGDRKLPQASDEASSP